MIRRYPDHVDAADENGYVSNCPNQVDVSTYGNPTHRLYICGCRYDQWPVSLVKRPVVGNVTELFVKKLATYVPMSGESFVDVYFNPDIISPQPLTWRERWSCRWIAFREWLGEKVTPDNWDDDYDSWGEW